MAAATTLQLPVFHPLVRGWHWRVVLVLMLMAASVALSYTPMLQQRFFYSGSRGLADLTGDDLQTSGRFAAWPLIYKTAWRHPLLGAGVGSISEYVPTVWTDMTHAHNDYLRIGFELGLVGLGVFLAVLVWQAHDLRRNLAQSGGPARTAFAASWLGFAGFLVLAVSDNPLIYNLWYMNPLFALLGAAYGVAASGATSVAASGGDSNPLRRPPCDPGGGWPGRRLSSEM
jgi:O-antigen ligase